MGIIAGNTQHAGRKNRGYAESWTREQVDSLLAEAWLKELVAEIRAGDETRRFGISATGGSEIAFAKVHGAMGSAEITNVAPGRAVVTLHTSEMSPVCRVDIAVFAKTPTSLWGAPSFVSFAVVDPGAPYSDPVLTPPQELAPQPGRPRPGKDAPDTPSKDETGTPPSGGPRPPGARP